MSLLLKPTKIKHGGPRVLRDCRVLPFRIWMPQPWSEQSLGSALGLRRAGLVPRRPSQFPKDGSPAPSQICSGIPRTAQRPQGRPCWVGQQVPTSAWSLKLQASDAVFNWATATGPTYGSPHGGSTGAVDSPLNVSQKGHVLMSWCPLRAQSGGTGVRPPTYFI